jgi:hypothetical protein
VFDGLDPSDGPAELVPDAGVGHGCRKHRLAESEAVASHRGRRPIEQPPDVCLRVAVEPPHRRILDQHSVGGHRGHAAAFIKDRLRGDGEPGSGHVDEDPDAGRVDGEQQQPLRLRGVGDEPVPACAGAQAGQVRSGLGFGEAVDPDLTVEIAGRWRRFCSSVPAASSVDAAW